MRKGERGKEGKKGGMKKERRERERSSLLPLSLVVGRF
jgi:hypothetical protein